MRGKRQTILTQTIGNAEAAKFSPPRTELARVL